MTEEKSEYPQMYKGEDLSTVQLLLSEELFRAIEGWLVRNGLEVSPPMLFAADELPTFLVLPPSDQ